LAFPKKVLPHLKASSAPYADLASSYVGSWLAATLDLVASISLLAIAIGTMNAGARILFALGRDSGSKSFVSKVSESGEPSGALWRCLELHW
jgi:amino acid transporter